MSSILRAPPLPPTYRIILAYGAMPGPYRNAMIPAPQSKVTERNYIFEKPGCGIQLATANYDDDLDRDASKVGENGELPEGWMTSYDIEDTINQGKAKSYDNEESAEASDTIEATKEIQDIQEPNADSDTDDDCAKNKRRKRRDSRRKKKKSFK